MIWVTTTVSINANIVTVTIPFSGIGNDDGNMAVAGFGGHVDPMTTNPTSVDYIPNLGHGIVGVDPLGDLPWLSLSPTTGSLFAGESDTVMITFDTHGLEQSGVLSGFIVIHSNDINQPVKSVPVSLLTEPVVGVRSDPILPNMIRLEQNYPNPFNPSTTIQFTLPHSIFVTLKIHNILGQAITTLLKRDLEAGNYSIEWNARGVASGVYYYRLQAGEFSETRKMIVLK